jgi:hypothetical protein
MDPRSRFWSRSAATVATLLLLAACATPGPTIRTQSDPAANLAAYRTWSFFEPFGLEKQGYQTLFSGYVKNAVQTQMQRRGLTYVAQGGDLLVNAGGKLSDKTRVTSTPAPMFGGYYGYRHGYYGGWAGYDQVDVTNYTEGTLTIDAVDAAKKQLVWQGTAVGQLTDKMRERMATVAPEVIGKIFEKFPVAPLVAPAQ